MTEDDVSEEDEGTPLPGNPALREVVPAQPSDRTAMIDLEAVQARRAARNAARAAAERDGAEDDDEKTPPPERAPEADPEATGTLARTRGGHAARRGATRSRLARDERPEDDIDDGAGGAAAEESRSEGGGTRSGVARREGTSVGREGTHTRPTRVDGTEQFQRPRRPRKALSPAAAASVVVLFVVGVIVAVFVAARATGVLTVTTVPHGASVVLDGEPIGTSPLQKRVRTGSHVIELSLPGYEPFREVVDVPSAGLPFLQPLKALPPPPPPPPSNAEIALDLAGQAKRLLDAGDLDGAIAKVDEIDRLVPDHAPSADVRKAVRAAQQKRDDERRRAAAASAREAQLAKARQLAAEGRRLYEQGKLGPARTTLFESLRLDPSNPDPHRTLAKIFNRENEVDKVRYHLERFLALGGNDADFKVREWLKAHPK